MTVVKSPRAAATSTRKLSLRVLLMALVAFCAIIFMSLRISVQNTHVNNQPTSLSKQRASFESSVKQNFVRSATTVKASSASGKNLVFLKGGDSSSTGKKVAKQQSSNTVPKILVIYFPQYHPDPLNDKNWGANFTDWDSLRKSRAKNRLGFDIPRPTELGYYDLRSTETRKQQGILAKQYGVDGFIYHHYWFYDPTHPGPNLEKPLLNMLQDGHPDVPFLLNWCATKWVNVWMGKAIFQTIPTNKNRAITLQEQFFDPTDDMIKEHYLWLNQFFQHPNYIKFGNQPVMMLYFYDPLAVPILEKLREFAKQDGWDGIYFIVGRSAYPDGLYDPSHLDEKQTKWIAKKMQHREEFAGLEKEGPFNQTLTYPYPLDYVDRPFQVPSWCRDGKDPATNNPFDQEGTGVITAFDNTPRREYQHSTIYSVNGDTPDEKLKRFEQNLYAALYYQRCCQKPKPTSTLLSDPMEDRFVAVNSWNEWAEGMAIEPSTTYGRQWLETIQSVKKRVEAESCPFQG